VNARAWYAWLDTAPPITWWVTIAECVFGYWLSTVGWSFTGGIVIGLAVGAHFSRVMRALAAKDRQRQGTG
jgi:hypothetical protein